MNRIIFRHIQSLKHFTFFGKQNNRPFTNYNYGINDVLKDVGKFREFTETDRYVWSSPYGKISLPNTTIDQYVWKNLDKWEDHVVIACGVTGRNYTYAKLRDHCAALAISSREKLGLKQDDIIAVCLPNVPGKLRKKDSIMN